MKKFLLLFCFFILFAAFESNAQVSCTNLQTWNSATIYFANDQITFNGNLYKAKWYTQNQIPGDIYGPWAYIGSCTGSGGSSTICSGIPQWTSTGVFQTGNEAVYNGTKYIAKWYT